MTFLKWFCPKSLLYDFFLCATSVISVVVFVKDINHRDSHNRVKADELIGLRS
jgi:hypothetical protein